MTKNKKRVDVVIGTRPEAIKMAPVILELRRRDHFNVRVVATGQHTEMLTQALDYFSLKPDVDMSIMRERQTLDYITSSVLQGVGALLDQDMPDAVLVHGDTTTTYAAALAAFYRRIPVGHVEAGLRSHDIYQPFPEEINRVMTDRIAKWWFAPTESARQNLVREGIAGDMIFVTGNTVVDALLTTVAKDAKPRARALEGISRGDRFILVTAHRRESWGQPLEEICAAIQDILNKYEEYKVVVPMHRNPAVREIFRRWFDGNDRAILCDPLDYPDFVWSLNHAGIILSDSGGVQEEASALAKPVLILRSVTERPEAVEHGSGILVGTNRRRIFEETDRLLSDKHIYEAVQKRCKANPFGDGKASSRIADILLENV